MTNGSMASVCDRTARMLLLIVVAVAPVPLGSNRDWAWSPIAVVIGLGLIAACQIQARPGVYSSRLAIGGLFSLGIAMLWAALQPSIPSSTFQSDFIFSTVDEALGGSFSARVAIDGERSRTGIMRIVTYIGVFWLAARFCGNVHYARWLLWTIVGTAVAVTIYGGAMQITTRSCVVMNIVKRPLESGAPCSFSGTFVNSGNYATYVGLAALICLAELQSLMLHAVAAIESSRDRWRRRLVAISGKGGIYFAALIVLFAGLLYSTSRAGSMSFVMASMAMITAMHLSRKSRATRIFSSISLFALFAAMLLSIGGGGVVSRILAFVIEGDSDRSALLRLTTQAIALRPLTGWGLGAFEPLYSVLQTPDLALVYDKAHNAYLESVVELGLPMATGFLLAICMVAARCLIGMWKRERDIQFPAMGFGASLLLGAVSLVDFGVQIPAISIVFAALLGMGWVQSFSTRHARSFS